MIVNDTWPYLCLWQNSRSGKLKKWKKEIRSLKHAENASYWFVCTFYLVIFWCMKYTPKIVQCFYIYIAIVPNQGKLSNYYIICSCSRQEPLIIGHVIKLGSILKALKECTTWIIITIHPFEIVYLKYVHIPS